LTGARGFTTPEQEALMHKVPFYLSGAGGGSLTGVLDLLNDPNQGTIARVGRMLKENLFGGASLFFGPAFWAIFLIVCASLFVCWVFEVTSRLDGFLRGCTVLAAFSIGAPSPIINRQITDITPGLAGRPQTAAFARFVLAASAETPSPRDHPSTLIGEVYIVLDHLKEMKPRPDSIVTIRNSPSQSAIAIFTIVDNTARISQPYGQYVVEIQTPGFSNITFDLTIDASLAAYSVNAQSSSVPIALQKLLVPTKVQPVRNDAEKFKQLGRQRRLVGDSEGAISYYQQSLSLEPGDGLTHDYLGYAFFRLARYSEAEQEFQIAIVQRPDYRFAPINLIKVDCVQQKYTEARSKFDVIRGTITVWKTDAEFTRLCAPILN
jgi:hypothetical protein